MSRYLPLAFCLAILSIFAVACDGSHPTPDAADQAIQQVYDGKLTVAQAQLTCRCTLEVVRLSGTVFHFGLDLSQNPPLSFPFQSTISGARIWIAEVPATRNLNVRSDHDGRWNVDAIKLKGSALAVSFVYEREGYPTAKSQVFQVGDTSITDLSVQFPTAAYFAAAKAQIEQQVGAAIGAAYPLQNIVVTTVGKSWASMYSPDLPHGDPGAEVDITPTAPFPASLGPVYFNASVGPDPTLTSTSVDGGILFGNLASGSYSLSAHKAPFSCSTLTFVVQDDIALYVASPPHGIQGTNSSPPGEN